MAIRDRLRALGISGFAAAALVATLPAQGVPLAAVSPSTVYAQGMETAEEAHRRPSRVGAHWCRAAAD
jgi:hypothetical protein